jgi:purine-nucleoside/S-methyl-5'-thioadenosine phosphorylase / adenosine deaminase
MSEAVVQKLSSGTVLSILAANDGLRHAFGTRELADVKSLARALNHQGAPVVSVRQVHGDGILVLDRSTGDGADAQKKRAQGYDALVTDQPGVVLAIRTADCLPVLMFDPEQRVIAAVHAGWRGILQEIVPKTLRCMMNRFSSRPSAVIIGIGPSIWACCYEVGKIVLVPLADRCSYWRAVIKESGEGKAMLNLQELVRRQLLDWGVPSGQIETAQACTACDRERFFSYRRDGKRAGSMYSGIVMEAT